MTNTLPPNLAQLIALLEKPAPFNETEVNQLLDMAEDDQDYLIELVTPLRRRDKGFECKPPSYKPGSERASRALIFSKKLLTVLKNGDRAIALEAAYEIQSCFRN